MAHDPRFGFDPVAAFLQRPLDEIVRNQPQQSPQSAHLDHSVHALEQQAATYSWTAVLQLSASLLASDEDEASTLLPHQRLLCTCFRALALLQTRQLERASDAISELGSLHASNRQYHYQTYPQHYSDTQTGSFVPFQLRVLDVEVRARQSDQTAIHDAYRLRHECTRQMRLTTLDAAVATWRMREALVLSCIASYHLKEQQHDAAVDVARQLLVQQSRSARALYMYARVLMHVGDLEGADVALGEAARASDDSAALQHVHRGMLLAARGQFQEALLQYDEALEKEQSGSDGAGSNVWVFAWNNAAICLMHCGRLAEAIDRLENTLRRNAEVALDEGVVFNLSTLYDLAYPDNCTEKKRVLQKLALRFGRQGFNLDRVNLV